MAIDPICGMTVDPAKAISAARDGETFYFCCEPCRKKFLAGGQRGDVPAEMAGHAHGVGAYGQHAHGQLIQLGPISQLSGASLSNAPSATGRAIVPPGTPYYCPMCPGVESDRPGICPKCGMALEPMTVSAETMDDDGELRDMTRRLIVSLPLSFAVFLLAMLPMVGVPLDAWLGHTLSLWLQLLLATPVVLWCGWPLLERGARSVVSRHFNMFTLIGLGVGAAYGYSVVALLFPAIIPESLKHHGQPEVYFESAAVIVTLVLLGQVLELRARRRTSGAIRELLSLAPPTARRIRLDVSAQEQDEIVPVEEVQSGDLLRIAPGDKVPVDGTVVEGRSALDEAMLTGEAVPVEKCAGDRLIGGTINGTGSLKMRAEQVGDQTVLAQIVNMVAQAQRSRAPIQRVADLVAGWFVPLVVGAAVVTFIAWMIFGPAAGALAYALANSVAVLIIACPCALGLATPMSIMVGVGHGARAGVLIKNAEVLERLERIDTIVVDKTGTLTEGKPRVTETLPATGVNERDLLRYAASVERESEHPLAAAIVRAAQEKQLVVPSASDFLSRTGKGVEASVEGKRVAIGNAEYLRNEHQAVVDQAAVDWAANCQAQGRTVMFAGIDGHFAGMIAVADPIKASTPAAIERLHALGLKIIMLTGDNARTAQAVAAKLGIDDFQAEVSPQDKHARVKQLQAAGKHVAMAGDGVNDAPALAAADVGIAMGTGAAVSVEAAGLTLVKGDLRGIVRAVRLGRRTMGNIRQNLFFAFIYNLLGVPIAAGILYPWFGLLMNPMIAAAAMSFSSVSVIGNALRLQTTKLD